MRAHLLIACRAEEAADLDRRIKHERRVRLVAQHFGDVAEQRLGYRPGRDVDRIDRDHHVVGRALAPRPIPVRLGRDVQLPTLGNIVELLSLDERVDGLRELPFDLRRAKADARMLGRPRADVLAEAARQLEHAPCRRLPEQRGERATDRLEVRLDRAGRRPVVARLQRGLWHRHHGASRGCDDALRERRPRAPSASERDGCERRRCAAGVGRSKDANAVKRAESETTPMQWTTGERQNFDLPSSAARVPSQPASGVLISGSSAGRSSMWGSGPRGMMREGLTAGWLRD